MKSPVSWGSMLQLLHAAQSPTRQAASYIFGLSLFDGWVTSEFPDLYTVSYCTELLPDRLAAQMGLQLGFWEGAWRKAEVLRLN